MFKYTNTIVVNSDIDSLSGKKRWQMEGDALHFKRVMKFEPSCVKAIYKREHQDSKLGKVTLDMSKITEKGFYRLKMYIRLSGSQNSFYSNDFVFKGKPFYIEFEVKEGETSEKLASKVAKLAQHLQQMYGNKYMKFSANSSVLTIDAIDEFQRFTQIEIQKFDETAGVNKVGEFKTIHTATIDEEDDGFKIEQGVEGFGDYFHILKDLRLPTVENTSWTSINAEEMPTPGAKYTQFTIHYEKNRGQVAGGGGVGEVIVSQTTHVFYVIEALVKEFEEALTNLGVSIISVVNGQGDLDGGTLENDIFEVSGTPTLTSGTTAGSFSVKSKAKVKATSTAEWITSVTVGTPEESTPTVYPISVTPSENLGKNRTAKIMITAGDAYASIQVTQPGAIVK